MMFKILVIQTIYNLSDERTEFLINDRFSFMRFLGLELSDRAPDARTIWLFWKKLTKAGSVGLLFERFDATLRRSGYIAMSGQIVDPKLDRWSLIEASNSSGASRRHTVVSARSSFQPQRLSFSRISSCADFPETASHAGRPPLGSLIADVKH